VAERLGVSEDAAKKRVGRALEKLRTALERRSGVSAGARIVGRNPDGTNGSDRC
jgi:hypothetical protein